MPGKFTYRGLYFFIPAVSANTFFNLPTVFLKTVSLISRQGFALTLFITGSGLPLKTIKGAGFKAFLLGIILWFVTAVLTPAAIFPA